MTLFLRAAPVLYSGEGTGAAVQRGDSGRHGARWQAFQAVRPAP
ncbi:hypothetical protein SUDANB37_03626 [Streptomyces sp. enrichment culture]